MVYTDLLVTLPYGSSKAENIVLESLYVTILYNK